MSGTANSTLMEHPQGLSSEVILPTRSAASILYDCVRPHWIRTTPAMVPLLGRWTKVRCRSRRCRGCAMWMALDDRKYIEGGLRHRLQTSTVVFITVAEPRQARGFADSGAALTMFVKGLHYSVGIRKGTGLSWCAVGELGEKTKHLHWHLLVAGLAYPWCKKLDTSTTDFRPLDTSAGRLAPGSEVVDRWGRSGRCVSKNSLLPLARSCGFGTGFVGLRQVRTGADDMSNVGSYMSKYLAKGDAGEELPKGFQLVRVSRGRNAWWPEHTLGSVRAAERIALRERRSASTSVAEASGILDASTSPEVDVSVAQPSLTLFVGGA